MTGVRARTAIMPVVVGGVPDDVRPHRAPLVLLPAAPGTTARYRSTSPDPSRVDSIADHVDHTDPVAVRDDSRGGHQRTTLDTLTLLDVTRITPLNRMIADPCVANAWREDRRRSFAANAADTLPQVSGTMPLRAIGNR